MNEYFSTYHNELYHKKINTLREFICELPPFVNSFFISIENNTTILTRVNYASDLKIFFNFLVTEIPNFIGQDVITLNIEILKQITIDHLYLFLDYLNLYGSINEQNKTIENHEHGKARKVACLRTFFKYFYKKGLLNNNICQLLDTPKLHEKPIIRLDTEEVTKLLKIVESGEGLTQKQKQFHKKNIKRDIAIITLFLTTGIRVSELVALDVNNLDFNNYSFIVTRKGGNQVMLYFESETANALTDYLNERKSAGTYQLSSPLFLSMQGKRLTVRSVENIVKKYAFIAAPLKRISPHKLRSTFGTMLYNETGDIYLVADVLGHKDVNTTRKHYAAMSDENRRYAAKAIKLRE